MVPVNLANLSAKLPRSNYTIDVETDGKKSKEDKSSNLLTVKNLQQIKSMKDIVSPTESN